VNHVVYPHLLILYVVVSSSLSVECSVHARNYSILGVHAALVEPESIIDFRGLLFLTQIFQITVMRSLEIINIFHELLPALKIPDAFVGTLLLLPQLGNPILNLELLVFLPLGRHNRVHH
jgi:hypothetical protein